MFQNTFPNYFYAEDGSRIFYCTNFTLGNPLNAPLLVFNYGLVCSNHHWIKQLPYFDKQGFNILIHDYRGHFNSSTADKIDTCNFQIFVNDLNGIIKETQTQSKIKNVIMIGHSMGVNVTLEYVKNYPHDLQGIILISGTVFPPHDVMFDSAVMDFVMPYVELMKKNSPKIFNSIWNLAPYLPLTQTLIRSGGFNSKKVSMEFIQIYLQKIRQLGPDLFFKLFTEMGKHNALAGLQDMNLPALVIGGDKDKVIPYYIQEIIHKNLKNSELYIVKDGSHVPQVDFPETVNERMHIFLNKFQKVD